MVNASAIDPNHTIRRLDVVGGQEITQGSAVLPFTRRVAKQSACRQAWAVSGIRAAHCRNSTQVANGCGRQRAGILLVRRIIVLRGFGRLERRAIADRFVPLPFLYVCQGPLKPGRREGVKVRIRSPSTSV